MGNMISKMEKTIVVKQPVDAEEETVQWTAVERITIFSAGHKNMHVVPESICET